MKDLRRLLRLDFSIRPQGGTLRDYLSCDPSENVAQKQNVPNRHGIKLCVINSLLNNRKFSCTFTFPLTAAVTGYQGSYFGSSDLPMIVAYTFCSGYESQLANCSGFRYQRSIPSYCDSSRVAGVQCLGECVCVCVGGGGSNFYEIN